jgi:hypothetical protein
MVREPALAAVGTISASVMVAVTSEARGFIGISFVSIARCDLMAEGDSEAAIGRQPLGNACFSLGCSVTFAGWSTGSWAR